MKRSLKRISLALTMVGSMCVPIAWSISQTNGVAVALASIAQLPVPERLIAHDLPLDYPGLDTAQPPLQFTGVKTDIAISGKGFLHIKLPRGSGDDSGYTRQGSLVLDQNSSLMVGRGYQLIPAIKIPAGATDVQIDCDGTVRYQPSDGVTRCTAGTIQVCTFQHTRKLQPQGDGIFTSTDDSGPAMITCPGEQGMGFLNSGFLATRTRDLLASASR